ncbi:hypothetical protein ABZ352_35410 [Streptomyces griseofuscus]|uniref:hypothetical protein n=1 Tax=Streptomyces griseofuscus TaxID=146922 RepID=UPI003401B5BD
MSVSTNLLDSNTAGAETDTSGWTAGSNTTLFQSTRWYNGAHSLGMTATAAGSVQATTKTTVAVTPGTTYQAYAYFANIMAVAGRTASVTINYWVNPGATVPAGNAIGASVTLANATTWNTPPPQVTSVAPASANWATVTVTVTGLAAGAQVATDSITLGKPYNSPVNLLPYTASSVETDASEWTAETNTVVTRTQPTAREGWYSLLLTSSAAGAMTTLGSAVPVVPGQQYMGQAAALSASGSIRLDLRWYDSTGTQISVTTGPSWTLASATWTTCNTVGTAPAGAATARLVLAPTATAAGQTWNCDVMGVLDLTSFLIPGNLINFADSDVEAGLTSGWSVSGGTMALSTAYVYFGTYAVGATATGGDLTVSLTVPVGAGAVVGQSYQLTIPTRIPTGITGALNFTTKIEWLDATGSVLRTRWQGWTLASLPSGWFAGPTGDIVPTGAMSVRVSQTVSNLSVGASMYVDQVQLTPGGLTVAAVPAGGGGVALTVNGLTTGGTGWLWTLTRIDSAGTSAPVRGWLGDLTTQTVTGDVAVITDYEAPLGVPVQWRVTLKDPYGTGLFIYTSDPVTIDASPTAVWLKDPGLPTRSVQVTVATPMPSWTTAARQGVSTVRGRALPVVISDVRAGKTGTLNVVTETDDDRAALDWVLSSGNVLLLQWPPGWGEDDIYVSVGDVQKDPVVDFAEFHDRTWTLPLTQVDRPIGGITGSPDRTWQTVKGSGGTWFDVLSDATSWLDVYTGA